MNPNEICQKLRERVLADIEEDVLLKPDGRVLLSGVYTAEQLIRIADACDQVTDHIGGGTADEDEEEEENG